jgi:fatty-acyl-CoA synthase
MAWVKLKDGSCITESEFVAACTGRIASYKIPRYWKFVDGIPMTISGKVQRFCMREMAAAETTAGGRCTPTGPDNQSAGA